MLLGYSMESAQGEWQSVLPYDESSGLIAELVGHLASLLMQLNIWRRGLAQERPLEEWLPVCRDMLNAFFLPDAETEAAMTLIEQQWQAIIAEGLGAQYGDAVPLSLLRDELAQRLDQERISQRFLAGPVNICTLTVSYTHLDVYKRQSYTYLLTVSGNQPGPLVLLFAPLERLKPAARISIAVLFQRNNKNLW